MGQVNLVRNINIKQLGPSLLNPTKVYQKFASKWAKMIWSILSFFFKKKDLMGQVTWSIMYMKKRLRKNDYFQFSQHEQVETR